MASSFDHDLDEEDIDNTSYERATETSDTDNDDSDGRGSSGKSDKVSIKLQTCRNSLQYFQLKKLVSKVFLLQLIFTYYKYKLVNFRDVKSAVFGFFIFYGDKCIQSNF